MQGQIERTFKLTEDGTSMVVALNQAFPQTDKCFNLYKD